MLLSYNKLGDLYGFKRNCNRSWSWRLGLHQINKQGINLSIKYDCELYNIYLLHLTFSNKMLKKRKKINIFIVYVKKMLYY